MKTRVCLMVMCCGIVLSARLAMALGGFEMELLMTKMDYMEDKMEEVEQTMKTTVLHEMENLLKKMEIRLQEKFESRMNFLEKAMRETEKTSKNWYTKINKMLIRFEKVGMERIGEVDTKFGARIQAMENSLQESVKKGEDNRRKKMEDWKNQLISKMDSIQLQQMAETKTFQETTQTALMKLGENKKTLDMLTDSMQNMSTVSEKNYKILVDHFSNPIRSCRQVMKLSGRYFMHVGQHLKPSEVLCEQIKSDGGWTVIQQRFHGSVDFYRNWTEYRNGFGNLDGEFWLGLEYVHQITKHRPHTLLVEIEDFYGNYGYAKYGEFEIGSESELYALKKLGAYSGTAGDAMRIHKNKKFSTFDRDNDRNEGNCAEKRHGAWWYWSCHQSNLNGRYQNTTDDSAMTWYNFKKDNRGMSYSRMMIRDIID